jgi:predicted Zn finger-like uncharacterized protein
MIVTCPICSTRYLVDPRALGSDGRVVRCANCAHTWHQTPPDDAPRRVDLALAETEIPLQTGARVQLPAATTRPRRSGGVAFWLLSIILLAAVVAGGLWWTREQVVARWPIAARYYATLGIAVSPPSGVLEFRNVNTKRDTENGLQTLVITGEVVNLSELAWPVPKLKVILQDGNKKDLQSWSFSVADERVLPRGSVPFRTSITDPSDLATGAVVIFDAGG